MRRRKDVTSSIASRLVGFCRSGCWRPGASSSSQVDYETNTKTKERSLTLVTFETFALRKHDLDKKKTIAKTKTTPTIMATTTPKTILETRDLCGN